MHKFVKLVFSRKREVKDVQPIRRRPRHNGKELWVLPFERRHTHTLASDLDPTNRQDTKRPFTVPDMNEHYYVNTRPERSAAVLDEHTGSGLRDANTRHAYVNVGPVRYEQVDDGDIDSFHAFDNPTYLMQPLTTDGKSSYTDERYGVYGCETFLREQHVAVPPGGQENVNTVKDTEEDLVRGTTSEHSYVNSPAKILNNNGGFTARRDPVSTDALTFSVTDYRNTFFNYTADTMDKLKDSITESMRDIEHASADAYDFDCANCSSNGIDKESFGFCVNCRKFLCLNCMCQHVSNANTKTHIIFESCMEDEGETNKRLCDMDDDEDGNIDYGAIDVSTCSWLREHVAERDECTHF